MIVALRERADESSPGGADVGEFGEKFRKQREQRGVTLEAVSNTTKISTRMLKALEEERFDQLPGGVFNKGFVRAYARQIGIDAEEAVSDYLAALRESQAQAQAIMPELRALRPEAADQPRTTFPLGNEIPAPDFRSRDGHKVAVKNLRADLHPPDTHEAAVQEPALHQADSQQPPIPQREIRSAVPEAQVQKAVERGPKERPRKKLIEERPRKPNLQPGVRIPWGIVAAALLVVALLLAFLSYRPHGEGSVASQPAQPAGESPVAAASPASGKPAAQSDSAPSAGALAAAPSPSPSTSHPSRSAASEPSAVPSSSGTAASNNHASFAPPSAESSSEAGATAAPSSASNQPASQPASASADLSASSSIASPPAAKSPSHSAASNASSASSGVSGVPPSTPAASSKPAPAPTAKEAVTAEASSFNAHPPTTAASPSAARVKAPKPFTLVIRAEQTSWVAITADGKPVARETLIAPAGISVRATQEIVVHAGNAGGLVFMLNGKTLPREGELGEPRTFLFDASGLHVIVPPSTTAPAP